MNKVICDICGTSYPDTADQCPICGYSRELNGDNILEDITPVPPETQVPDPVVEEEDDFLAAPAPAPVPAAFEEEDEDEYDEDDEDDDDEDEDDDEDDDDDEDEDEPRSNTGLVVILVILIVLLLGVMGFIFVRYFLPNMSTEDTQPSTAAPIETTGTVATTEPTIPCESLAMVSEGIVILEEEGANWLINVAPTPENTTDKILYASSDESVVTVNEAGKLTAVGQGEAVITITCGEQLLQCKVTCFFIEETTEPIETTAPETFPDETTAPTKPEEPTEAPEETTAPTEPEETQKPSGSGEVTLTLNKKDITFSVVPAYYTLEILEEDVDLDQVKWVSTDGNVAICHKGKLQIVGYGTCKITAEYKGVKAECIIRVIAR